MSDTVDGKSRSNCASRQEQDLVSSIMTQESLASRSILRSAFQAVILVLGASSILSAHAQSFQPVCASEAAYASLEGRGLYVQGGFSTSGKSTGQAFTIDLSQSWDAANPKYKQLPNGNPHNYSPSGITSDGKLWTVLIGYKGMRYDATSNSWSENFKTQARSTIGLTGATDHATDTMYIPNGYPNAERKTEMLRVNLKNGTTSSDRRSSPFWDQKQYATAWNPLRKSVIAVTQNGVSEYTWEKGWKSSILKGLDTIPSRGACLVSVSGGKKMALFGGVNKEDTETIGDIYILHLEKKGEERWTKASVDSNLKSQIARHSAACGSTGDQVIVWGGSTDLAPQGFQCSKQQTLVFDVNSMKWTNKYVAPKKSTARK
ncbi:MAG: hypothetical protein J3Q66DRAFT_123360 [Benniella sp.]|nr:MAG: hypothetical protein J3Q66DRAFT_123360 [Benniella sp.]